MHVPVLLVDLIVLQTFFTAAENASHVVKTYIFVAELKHFPVCAAVSQVINCFLAQLIMLIKLTFYKIPAVLLNFVP